MSILTVTTTADSGSGSLRAAIAQAKSGSTIKFAKNLAGKTITLSSGQLSINKDLTIDGAGASGLTISGNRSSRVIQVEQSKKVAIKNISLANGRTKGGGGAINASGESQLTLQNVDVNNNMSELGGGIHVGYKATALIVESRFKGNNGTLTNKYAGFSAGAISHEKSKGHITVKGSTFSNNIGFNGGAIYGRSTQSFTVENSVFRSNIAKSKAGGGAIFTDGVSVKGSGGLLTIRGSRFEGNQADGEGGALFLWGYGRDKAVLKDSAFINNVARLNRNGISRGGAVRAQIGLDIDNVTFANNTATQQGGGIWAASKLPLTIDNSTFSNNRAIKDAGGGLFLKHQSVPITIKNSTIAYNQAGRANGALWYNKAHRVKISNSIVALNTAQKDRRQDQVGFAAIDGGGNVEFSTNSKAMRAFKNSRFVDPKLKPLAIVGGDWVHQPGNLAVKVGDTPSASANRITAGTKSRERSTDSIIPTSKKLVASSSLDKPSVADRGLMVHLALDESGRQVAKDSATEDQAQNGHILGKAKWVKGVEGKAIALDGKSNAIALKHSGGALENQSGRTVSLWFKTDKTRAGKGRQVLYEEGGAANGLNIYMDKDRLFVGSWYSASAKGKVAGRWISTGKVAAGRWHHVALVADKNQRGKNVLQGHLNGRQFGEKAISEAWSPNGRISLGAVQRGTRFHDGLTPDGGSHFTGAIDEVKIYNDALSKGLGDRGNGMF